MKLLVVIPAKNEAESIVSVIEDLQAHGFYNILVIDDGSEDNTRQLACQSGAVVLSHIRSLGAWKAIQTGFRYALKKGYEQVVTFDADGQHQASELQKLLNAYAVTPCDVVIGACVDRADSHKHLAWWIIRKLTGLTIKDITSGFRLYNSATFHILASRQATLFDYQDVGVLMLLAQSDCIIHEVDVQMSQRIAGDSKIFGSIWSVAGYFLSTLVLGISKRSSLSQKRDE